MLKSLFVAIVATLLTTLGYARNSFSGYDDVKSDDSTRVSTKKTTEVSIELGKKDDYEEQQRQGKKAPGVSFGLTFSRFDIGFTKLLDNGSFTLSDANSFLDYNGWKSSNVGFDLLQFGFRTSSSFKIYVAGGIDWTHLRLDRDVTIRRDAPELSYDESPIHFSKNRFSSTYLRIPVSFEFRTKDDNRGKKFRFVVGPELGFLLNGKVKQVSKEDGKQKFNDSYNFTKFRYGAVTRIGYGGAGLFFKYYFNDMFENSVAQEGLRNLSFGLTFGF